MNNAEDRPWLSRRSSPRHGFRVCDSIWHPKFGTGIVSGIDRDRITVSFHDGDTTKIVLAPFLFHFIGVLGGR
jgi:hypothetical protein